MIRIKIDIHIRRPYFPGRLFYPDSKQPDDRSRHGETRPESLRGAGLFQVLSAELPAKKLRTILAHEPGRDSSIGGLEVIIKSEWYAARRSGSGDIYKIYAQSFRELIICAAS